MLVDILSNLKGRAEKHKYTKPYNWAAISKLMQNATGQALDYETFKQEVDANPNLSTLFYGFDQNGITFVEPVTITTGPEAQKAKSQSNIDSSAKKAAASTLNRI
jgi:hypothetical protein